MEPRRGARLRNSRATSATRRAAEPRVPTRFDRLVQTLAARPSRRAIVASLGGSLVAALGGRAVVADGGGEGHGQDHCQTNQQCDPTQPCVNGDCHDLPPICAQKHCFDDGHGATLCVACIPGRDPDRWYARFASCIRDKAFCTRPSASCCGFCAKWAGDGHACDCC